MDGAQADVLNGADGTLGGLRPLTLDEKKKLRAQLDRLFDDEKGAFLQGSSDTTIGKATGIAWGRVKVFREEFYGPLREPDAVEKLEVEIRELHSQATKLMEEVSTVTRDFGNRVEGLERFANKIRREIEKLKGARP